MVRDINSTEKYYICKWVLFALKTHCFFSPAECYEMLISSHHNRGSQICLISSGGVCAQCPAPQTEITPRSRAWGGDRPTRGEGGAAHRSAGRPTSAKPRCGVPPVLPKDGKVVFPWLTEISPSDHAGGSGDRPHRSSSDHTPTSWPVDRADRVSALGAADRWAGRFSNVGRPGHGRAWAAPMGPTCWVPVTNPPLTPSL